MIIVNRQVSVTLPQEDAISCLHGLWLYETHIDENLDALLHHFLIDCVSFAVLSNLIQDGLRNCRLMSLEYFLHKEGHALLANKLQLIVFEVVAIQIFETAIHHLGVDDVRLPAFD